MATLCKDLKKKVKDKSKNPPIRTFGPLHSLETHLKSDWWKTIFNSIYLKTDGDVVENHRNTTNEVDLIVEHTGIGPDDNVLDICCGQGRHSIELAKRGHNHVTGIDRSRYLIRVAKKRAEQNNLKKIVFFEGDARKIPLPTNSQDAVLLMGNSFGYFDKKEEDVIVINEIKRLLRPYGTLVLDITDGDWLLKNFEPRSWEWIDGNYLVCRERNLSSKGDRIISREVVIHAEKGIIADQLYAERFYSLNKIQSLLEENGFIDIKYHGKVETLSHRNQDLGMMANRLFITAKAPEEIPAVLFEGKKLRVGAILGDANLPDKVKKDGKFNEEDFATINSLKNNLALISKIDAKYLNTHKNLMSSLQTESYDLILNLCDEGFYNDPFKELHVPAFLEMLNIPYTGAGPSCLALCYNKSLVRALAKEINIPVPEEFYYDPEKENKIPNIYPALLKPNFGDSSMGITKDAVVKNEEQLQNYLIKLQTNFPRTPILIQEFLEGKEFSVAVLGNPGDYTIFPILEVDYSFIPKEFPPILSYESKWIPESVYWNNIRYKEAQIDNKTKTSLIDYSTLLFERLDCRDYARFDFRADKNGVVKLLEVNPNPGWCWDGKMNIMAGFKGMKYHEFLELIIDSAIKRYQKDKKGFLSSDK
jgi:D-alanine-D-alanine ligase